MPELPEVETTVRKLKPLLMGKRILDLKNRKVLDVERRGKAILIWLGENSLLAHSGLLALNPLSGGSDARTPSGERSLFSEFSQLKSKSVIKAKSYLLAFHQRMSGRLLVVERDYKDKYIRRRFKLSDGKDLAFHDVRRFGVVWYGPAEKVLNDNYFRNLGEDALSVSLADFKNKLFSGHGRRIKSFLLDQKNLSGIGNIMADEILWRAKIHPESAVAYFRDTDIKNLHGAIRFILSKSIKLGGSSMRDWFHPDGSGGGYFEKRSVYGREDEKCPRCNTEILRKKIAGRSSYYCAKCQRV